MSEHRDIDAGLSGGEGERSPFSLRGRRIGLVATRALQDLTGVGVYTRNLIEALAPRLEDLHVICARSSDVPSPGQKITLPSRLVRGSTGRFLAPGYLRRYGFSLLHFMTEWELYWWCPGRARTVVTIHGCAWATLPPEWHEPLPRRAIWKYRRLLHRVDAVVTVSTSSRREIIKAYRIPPEKIAVVHNGLAEPFRRRAWEFRERPRSERPFILSVCAIIPKKNLIGVLEAFARVKAQGLPHRLVHVGPRGWGYEAVQRRMRELGLEPHVEFKGVVSTEELIRIYSAADVLLFPSFHEGFGLPILEAMACGCPVITSNCSAMPEVAGDAAVLVDPYDPGSIARAIHHVITDDSTRRRLIERGRQRARQFSWERSAREVVRVYERVLEDR